MSTPPLTLVGYLRVSTPGQADNLSLPVQEATLRAESERELLSARQSRDKAGEVDAAAIARTLGMVAPVLLDKSLPLHLRAEALRMVVRSATPFDAEPPRKKSAAPTPGAVVEIADGVGSITIRTTLSGIAIAAEVDRG